MGAQQVLRATAYRALIAGVILGPAAVGTATAAPKERVAIIDLGPGPALGPTDPAVRTKLAAAVVDAGLQPLFGDGIEDALAGLANERDTVALAAAIGDAARAFGQLDCAATISAAKLALPILAARQAAGVAVPELPRAWAYVLLCADRSGDPAMAIRAASRLRLLGAAVDGTAALLAKYPDVDAIVGNDPVEVDVTADVADAALWVDFEHAGNAPARLVLSPGEHIIAAATGSRRGFLIGTPIVSQPRLDITMIDQAGAWDEVATRISSWHGRVPKPDELAWVLDRVHARAALIRHGEVVEVWGRAGSTEPPRRLGGDDGTRSIAEADRAAALLADRVEGWSAHTPDPDQPLLVEDVRARGRRIGGENEPTKWWVYATIGAAIAAGAVVIYAHHTETNTQHLELHYP